MYFVSRQNGLFVVIMKRHNCFASHDIMSARHSQRHLVDQLQLHIRITDDSPDPVTPWQGQCCLQEPLMHVLKINNAQRLRLCCRMYTSKRIAEVGFSVVRQGLPSGSHRLYPNVESIQMTALLDYLADNGDVAFCIGNLVYLSLHLSVSGWRVNVQYLIH